MTEELDEDNRNEDKTINNQFPRQFRYSSSIAVTLTFTLSSVIEGNKNTEQMISWFTSHHRLSITCYTRCSRGREGVDELVGEEVQVQVCRLLRVQIYHFSKTQ